MPLSLGNIVFTDLGLGGTATGLFHYARPREGLPTGEARLMIRQLTRSISTVFIHNNGRLNF